MSFPELTTAVEALLGPELGAALRSEFEIDATQGYRALDFEGHAVNDAVFEKTDGIAARAGEYVAEHFFELTGCAEPPDPGCVTDFVLGLAERAYRRPLVEAERSSLERVLSEAQALGATLEEVAQYGAYAVFESPGFIYRSEFAAGEGAGAAEVRLTAHELASELSFFVTGGPPDRELLDAAASDALSTRDELFPHVERLLSSEAGRSNLENAVLSHFRVNWLDTVVIDPTIFPAFDEELKSAMREEARAFVSRTLFGGDVGDLLSSRSTRVNESLAELYGIEFPPPGVTPDANGFADVVLPEERSGLLTMGATLTARSRPERGSVVLRGLWVRELLCLESPPVAEFFSEPQPMVLPMSEREKAEARMATTPCSACHLLIDPFGLALEQFDAIGRFRTEDSEGNPIDPAVTLPEEVGGMPVANAVELGAAISGDRFVACLGKSFLDDALAETKVALDGCEVEEVLDRLDASGERSFAALIREVALSKALAVRGAVTP